MIARLIPRSPFGTGSLMLAAGLWALTACSRSHYAGIPLAAGAAPAELQALAEAARMGDKHAQLQLGIRYEEGRGVAPNLGRARQLYQLAATSSGGTLYVYSPPVGRNGRGSVIPVNTGPLQPGLPAAKIRLKHLSERTRND